MSDYATNTQPSRVNVRQTEQGNYIATVAYRNAEDAAQYLADIGRIASNATTSERGGMVAITFPITPGIPAAQIWNPMNLTPPVAAHVVPLVQAAVAATNAMSVGLAGVSDGKHQHPAESFVAQIANAASRVHQI